MNEHKRPVRKRGGEMRITQRVYDSEAGVLEEIYAWLLERAARRQAEEIRQRAADTSRASSRR